MCVSQYVNRGLINQGMDDDTDQKMDEQMNEWMNEFTDGKMD